MDIVQKNVTILHQEKIQVSSSFTKRLVHLEIIEAKTQTNELSLFHLEENEFAILVIHEGTGGFHQLDHSFALFPLDTLIIEKHNDFYLFGQTLHFTLYVMTNEEAIVLPITPSIIRFSDSSQMNQLLTEIINQMKENQIFLVFSFLNQLFHLFTQKQESHILPPILSAISYMEEHFQEEIHLDEITKASGFSKFHFIRLFQTETSKTPYQYLLDRRILHAKYLLTHTKDKMKEVATKSGFHSEVHFNYAFKKETSYAPNQYRKSAVSSPLTTK